MYNIYIIIYIYIYHIYISIYMYQEKLLHSPEFSLGFPTQGDRARLGLQSAMRDQDPSTGRGAMTNIMGMMIMTPV